MNDLILVEAHRNEHIYHNNGYCVNCKGIKLITQVRFIYSKWGIERRRYYLYLCQECFKAQIEDKPLHTITHYIPLILLKPNRAKSQLIDAGVVDTSLNYNVHYHPRNPDE